jgi:hypothetical protein
MGTGPKLQLGEARKKRLPTLLPQTATYLFNVFLGNHIP